MPFANLAFPVQHLTVLRDKGLYAIK